MIRRLFQFAIFLFVANALYQTAPIGVHYFQFKDALQELALFGQKSTDNEMVDQVMLLAAEHKIPLERDYVAVTRTTTHVIISAWMLGLAYSRGRGAEAASPRFA